jgi:hypothetical protein
LRAPEGCQLREIRLESPDGTKSQARNASVQDDFAEFIVPELNVYDLILMCTEKTKGGKTR